MTKTLSGDPSGGSSVATGRRPTARVLVSPETAALLDDARIDAISTIRRDVTKTDLADAMVRVALNHMDEVVALLTGETK
ncbi:hypothetical protein GCM10010156_76010 [Planobispora rosea]|uniref:Uncharacterized protein n=2 Tax=Planobispora rosea TaxID=35762 RepID=A0A8J3SAQ2_PLARO|nr:hypothetical protein GCM10010156_76010 [Planobispora rosea]GIH89217.1 hypothetical protein Pro02_76250 [Planobispora rosea]